MCTWPQDLFRSICSRLERLGAAYGRLHELLHYTSFFATFIAHVTQPHCGSQPVKTCVQCRGKLGLGSRARNLWNGRWWSHVYFCSTRCKDRYELERSEANAKHRWLNFLAHGYRPASK
jgi:hypothetical protein